MNWEWEVGCEELVVGSLMWGAVWAECGELEVWSRKWGAEIECTCQVISNRLDILVLGLDLLVLGLDPNQLYVIGMEGWIEKVGWGGGRTS